MLKSLIVGVAFLLATQVAVGDESEPDATDKSEAEENTELAAGENPETAAEENTQIAAGQPKTMSGMSILGNEEAPKSLVIIPWKSSELGADPGLSNTLDDRAQPVDKEVFMRELRFYEIRAGK